MTDRRKGILNKRSSVFLGLNYLHYGQGFLSRRRTVTCLTILQSTPYLQDMPSMYSVYVCTMSHNIPNYQRMTQLPMVH